MTTREHLREIVDHLYKQSESAKETARRMSLEAIVGEKDNQIFREQALKNNSYALGLQISYQFIEQYIVDNYNKFE